MRIYGARIGHSRIHGKGGAVMNSLFPSFDHFNKPAPPVDVCARKHHGNPASADAFERADIAGDAAEALRIIRSKGKHGATAKEVAAEMNKSLNAVSGRCSRLKFLGLVRETAERRDHSTVLVVVEG